MLNSITDYDFSVGKTVKYKLRLVNSYFLVCEWILSLYALVDEDAEMLAWPESTRWKRKLLLMQRLYYMADQNANKALKDDELTGYESEIESRRLSYCRRGVGGIISLYNEAKERRLKERNAQT